MSNFDYQNKQGMTEEFRKKFVTNIKGKDAVKVEGLTVLAHEKGMWKFETEIIQFPSNENQWTAICKTTIGGYDWDPIEEKVIRVEYSDIGDANPKNCTSMVAASYIRMASTRSQGRALRKYTNVDMVCSSEIDALEEPQLPPPPLITQDQLLEVKSLLQAKNIDKDTFGKILFGLFQHTNYSNLTQQEGNTLLQTIRQCAPGESKDT